MKKGWFVTPVHFDGTRKLFRCLGAHSCPWKRHSGRMAEGGLLEAFTPASFNAFSVSTSQADTSASSAVGALLCLGRGIRMSHLTPSSNVIGKWTLNKL